MTTLLSTRAGQGLEATLAASRDLTGSTVKIEFATNSQFKVIALTKTPVFTGREVNLVLTPAEVTTLKDAYFRVVSTKALFSRVVETGRIDYTPAPAPAQGAVDLSQIANAAELKTNFGPFFAGKSGQKYRSLLGTIRNVGAAGGYWQPVSDVDHRPTGIGSVVTSASEITVNYDFQGTGIGTVIAVTDETMASEGYFLGSSVAANQCRIRLARRKTFADYIYWDTTTSTFKSANNVFTVVSYAAGVLTLSHPTVIGSFQNNARLTTRGGAYRAVVSTSSSPLTETQTKVEIWTAGGVLATAGAADMKIYVERYDVAGWIDPRTAIDTTGFPNHNIWLFGLHEMGTV